MKLATLLSALLTAAAVACGQVETDAVDGSAAARQGTGAAVVSAPAPQQLDTDVAPADPLKRQEPNVAAAFSRPEGEKTRSLEIIDVLPKDAIPSIDNPSFLDAGQASEQMSGEDLVIGISLNGEHKAYSTAYLSSHEIVNDTVGGKPVAVTW